MIGFTHSVKDDVSRVEARSLTPSAIARPSYQRATAYIDVSDHLPVEHRVETARSMAAGLGANLDRVYYGSRELPKFLSRMLTFDHVVASSGGTLDLEARVIAASWSGTAETTFYVDRSLRWIVPFAIGRLASEIVASQADEDFLQDVSVVRRGADARARLACAYLRGAEEDVVKRLYDASINAAELGSRLRETFVEDPSIDARGADLRQMTRDLRRRKFDVVLFEDGRPAELSVSVTALRSKPSQSFELVSSFQGADPLLDVLAAMIGDRVCRFRSSSKTLETA